MALAREYDLNRKKQTELIGLSVRTGENVKKIRSKSGASGGNWTMTSLIAAVWGGRNGESTALQQKEKRGRKNKWKRNEKSWRGKKPTYATSHGLRRANLWHSLGCGKKGRRKGQKKAKNRKKNKRRRGGLRAHHSKG